MLHADVARRLAGARDRRLSCLIDIPVLRREWKLVGHDSEDKVGDQAVPVWPLVRGLTEHDRDELLGMARRRTFRRGEVVFHEGDRADSVHLIEEGHVASRAFTEDGDTVTYQVLGPGEVFGLLSLQSGVARRYGTTVALDAAVTHVVDAELLRTRCLGDPVMGQVLIDLLA